MCGAELANNANGRLTSSSPCNSPNQAEANGNGNGTEKKLVSSDSIINLNQGDPTMFEGYWKEKGEKCKTEIEGWHNMSYFAEDFAGKRNNLNVCWFMLSEFEEEVRRLHHLVGNAVTEDRYIVVGTGSMQLFQAALYAYALSFPLEGPDSPHPISVVCAAPYYSSYPPVTDFLKSGLYEWAGDARSFKATSNEPYIELITSPNNPDGFIREPVVSNRHRDGAGEEGGGKGKEILIHDLAYYWPHHTAITAAPDEDVMLFTLSKATGHAGSRLGWALVKDKEVAMKMVKFLELNTIGVSKDSQLRGAKILRAISDSCSQGKHSNLENGAEEEKVEPENFFEYGRRLMADRWSRLRNVVKDNGIFNLPEYPKQFCNFTGEITETCPGFAFMKAKEEEEGIEDSESFLKEHKILTRGGKNFGSDSRYVRVSLLDREETFNSFLERFSTINSSSKKLESNGDV
ncbi:L-tryptophan--pyruvate aminotransferase 1-like [Macadamia integrifolia]|uniref:L-tryptophan--pyruvate aminotransferase 1-like n=1 Tax=Macadamia integrifolia TaxID=60698 RepID=UPI001C52AC6B|nr:L-tryptophan--pyruvate aminotransferase 1-like [Macadamia integrifolia]